MKRSVKIKYCIAISILVALQNMTSVFAQGFIIPSNGYVINNGNIAIRDNFINNGSFTDTSGTLIFNGTTQSIAGSSATSFNNITLLTGSTTTINTAGETLKSILLSNGTLNANNKLTLISNASKTALVSGSGTGSVTGNLTMQRYLASGFGYKYFSSPFGAAKVAQVANDLDLNASFPTLYKYDENQASSGWITYTDTTGLLNPLQGYAGNFGTASLPKTVDIAGVVNNNAISATLYNHNQPYTKGFNLVGNPFPSPIDWNASSGWVKTNIDDALYFFNAGTTDQYTGTYSSYINGVSSDGIAGNLIASMQGFFVHVTDGSYPVTGQLSADNRVRTTNLATVFQSFTGGNTNLPLIRLSASLSDGATTSDAAVFYMDDAATTIFNRRLDALKLLNTNDDVPSLYSLSSDKKKRSITGFRHPTGSTVIPLGLTTKKEGWINFNAKNLQHIPSDLHIYFYDASTGIMQDLEKNPRYRVYLGSETYDSRFSLVFSHTEIQLQNTNDEDVITAYTNSGKLLVNIHLLVSEGGNLIVVSMSGQVISQKQVDGNGVYQFPAPLTKGIYIVSFSTAHNRHSKKIFIGEQ